MANKENQYSCHKINTNERHPIQYEYMSINIQEEEHMYK